MRATSRSVAATNARRAGIALDLTLAAALAGLAAYSLVSFSEPFPLATLSRGEALLWRISRYMPDSLRLAGAAAAFATAGVGLRRGSRWRWWAHAAALALLLLPFAVISLLG